MSKTLAAFLILSIPAYLVGQCTKDTDCKGNRICVDGECISQNVASPKPHPDSDYCENSQQCHHTQICIFNECEDRDWVVTTGNVSFVQTFPLYAAGFAGNTVMPVVAGLVAIGNEYGGTTEEMAGAGGITGGTMLVFGGLNQIPRAKQRRYLRNLEYEMGNNQALEGLVWYGIACASSGATFFAQLFSQSKSVPLIVALANAPIQIIAGIKNSRNYFEQRGMLRDAVFGSDQNGGTNIELKPNVQFTNNSIGVGLHATF